MNNRTQQKFDRSVKDAAKVSGKTRENDLVQKRLWAAMDRATRMPEKMAAAPTADLDDLIARLVARDALKAE